MSLTQRQAAVVHKAEAYHYEPKERILGGMVLFALMMLLYLILKAVLGISSTGVEYALREALPDEKQSSRHSNSNSSSALLANRGKTTSSTLKYAHINDFVFLDLNGKPMQDGGKGNTPLNSRHLDNADPRDLYNSGHEQWYVQAASFRERSSAKTLVKKLKSRKFKANIVKKGKWYAVRLLPQDKKSSAKRQLRLLRNLSIKGELHRSNAG